MRQALFWLQGCYYLATGIWPLVHVESFQWVTGPKTDHYPTGRGGDHWLVMTVGVLITAIAAALLVAAYRHSKAVESVVLAVVSATGLTIIDIVYVSRGVIAPIYLVDAVAELLLLAAWGVECMKSDRSRSS